MPRFRVKFGKLGDMRFLSHLDMSHAFERAARRAGLHLAFSKGFHPHPKIAFASALPVGTTSEAEYVDIELTAPMPVEALLAQLRAAMPEGMPLYEGVEVPDGAKSLMASVALASYEAVVVDEQTAGTDWSKACEDFMALESAVVRKKTKSGPKDVDIRALVCELAWHGASTSRDGLDQAVLKMTLAAGSEGTAKPEDVVAAMSATGITSPCAKVVRCHRTGLYGKLGGERVGLMEAWR